MQLSTHSYIKSRFSSFGINLSEANLFDIWDTDEEITDDNKRDIQISIVRFIPELLLQPNISEGGVSINYDKVALRDYYNIKCKEYGITNVLTRTPKIRFI